MYYRGAQAAIVVYDITNATTFERAQDWVSELHTQGDADVEVCFVGNKADLESERAVEGSVAKAYCEENNLCFMESSAKTGLNVSEMFNHLGASLLLLAFSSASSPFFADLLPSSFFLPPFKSKYTRIAGTCETRRGQDRGDAAPEIR
jgi:signal recognition particle receptor subunit beta